ncbi:helix-turn-helix domain-containing protein [Shimia sp. MIT910701]|uniref:helix-turn-helix domain-containing protein n=1 Tax=Shimia sp. MIT910701 TaxID=3096987 RepID=UPI003999CFFD
MDKPFADISARLRWHRALLGLTQDEYAVKANLKRAQLNNWENGNHRIGLDGARALRKTYGLSLDFIYEGDINALPMNLRNALLDKPIAS